MTTSSELQDNTQPAAAADDTPTDALADVAATHTVTDAERAALAEDPETTPAPAAAAAADGKGDAAPAAPAAQADAASTTTPPAAEAAPAAAATPAAADVPDPQPAAAPAGPALLAVPEAPKDFAAEQKAIQARYDAGDIDDDERDAQIDALRDERAAWIGRKSAIEAQNEIATKQFQEAAAHQFEAAAKSWMDANKEFMANPLRAQAMQQAINAVDTETGGTLAPADLMERASKIVFDAYSWDPAAHGATPSTPTQAQLAAKLAERQPATDKVPRTLGDAPSAGTDTQGRRFEQLDEQSITDVEAAVAGMTEAERDAWLREVDAPLA